MAKGDYLKQVEADYVAQHDQFKTAAHEVGATVGFTAGDLTAIDADNAALHTAVTASNAAEWAGPTDHRGLPMGISASLPGAR